MDILQAIVLGIIEGITEFLPISSTGHLIVASHFMALLDTDTNKAFEVIIQVAAILAVVAHYKDKFTPKHVELWSKVTLAFLPIGVMGLLFHKQVKTFFTVPVVGVMFIVGGVIFLLIEYCRHDKEDELTKTDIHNVEDISYKQALYIGIAQMFALVPGTSRAGSTIVGAMLSGISRKTAAEFSFLLGLPVITSAAAFDLLKHYQEFSSSDFGMLAIGFITSFIIAHFTIKLFLRFLQNFTFVSFGVYRILFGVMLLTIV